MGDRRHRVRRDHHGADRRLPDPDVTVWGWIHLLVGIAVLATGFGLFGRRPWAGVAAIMLCMLSALVNFVFIPY